MVIKSSKQDSKEKINRVVTAKATELDSAITLRPKDLSGYVGQNSIKKHLSVSIASAKIRKEPLEHILFYGPPGLGKTTISNIIAYEMGGNIKTTSGPAIEKQSDLVSILSNLEEGDILFIDEIHRLRSQIEEILYTAMEDNTIDIMVGKGTGAQSVRLPIKPFTLIGATTKLSSLSAPLRDRFGNILKLDFYNQENLEEIISNNSKIINIDLGTETILTVAKKSRGTPRVANRLLKILRDYHTIGKNISDKETLTEIFNSIGIDKLGLDYLDKKMLEAIHYKFKGGPVGLNTLASSLGEEESTIEEVVEPYLLQIGFIERTPRGRIITMEAVAHLLKN